MTRSRVLWRKRARKKKKKAPSTQQPSSSHAGDLVQKVAEAPKAAILDEEHGGFQTVGKGKIKGLASAKSLESLPQESTSLAAEATQAAEQQAGSPYIQNTVEIWTKRMQDNKAATYLAEGGKLLTWREVLLSCTALETLISTCLSERVDASLEPLLATLFANIAPSDSAAKRSLAEGLAGAVVKLAQTLDHNVQQNVEAANNLLRQMLALLRAPAGSTKLTAPREPVQVDAGKVEAQIEQRATLFGQAKLPKQKELWEDIKNLWQSAASGKPSYASTSEPEAVTSLRQYEETLQRLQQNPVAQKLAADAEREKLAERRNALETRLEEAKELIKLLQSELLDVGVQIAKHDACQAGPQPQISQVSLKQQLHIVKQLKGSLGASEPVAAPNSSVVGLQTRAAFVNAARQLLAAQLKLQREVAQKGLQGSERYTRKQQQVQQLTKLGESKELRTAAGHLDTISNELENYKAESTQICEFVESVVDMVRGSGVATAVVAELLSFVEMSRQQHGKILDGPLRVPGPVAKEIGRAPLVGNSVATSSLQQPIACSQDVTFAPPPPREAIPAQPAFSPASFQPAAYNQWQPAAGTQQPAWNRSQAHNFGDLLQGSSVSQAPSKVPAPIAPASLQTSVETPREGLPTVPHNTAPSVPPTGGLQMNGGLTNAAGSLEVPGQPLTGSGFGELAAKVTVVGPSIVASGSAPVGSPSTNSVLADGGKGKRHRQRKQR